MLSLDPIEGANAYRQVLDSIRQYLDEMEVPEPIIQEMIKTSSADIIWTDNLDETLERPPSLAEWEDANCGSVSKKDHDALSKLEGKRSKLTIEEQSLRDELKKKESRRGVCKFELLSSYRDKLSAP
jgi:hypothetical protein